MSTASADDIGAVDAVSGLPAPGPLPPVTPAPDGDLSLQQLASAAAAPTYEAPDAVDSVLASVTPPAALPPPVPAPSTPVEAAAQGFANRQKIGEEQVANAEAKSQEDIDRANQEAQAAQEKAQRIAQLQERQAVHRQAAEQHYTELRAHAESEPFHTLMGTRSIGEKAAIGVGLLLGGISWNANHVNRGAQMLQQAEEEFNRNERDKHANLWKAVDEAASGLRALDSSDLHELASAQAREAAYHDALASRLSAAAAASKGKRDVTAAKSAAQDELDKANKGWENAIAANASANHLSEMNKELAARAEKDRAQAAKAKAAKIAAGSGGSAKETEAVATLTEEIEKAKSSGKPLGVGEITRRGAALGLKPIAKAGRPSVKTVMDSLAKESKDENLGIKHDEAEANKIVRFDGKPYAIAGTAKIAAKAADEDVQRGDAISRLKELAKDIKTKGAKIDPTDTNAVQERVSKFANAIIAIGIVSPLGKTNETLHLETKALGIPGVVDWDHLNDSLRSFVTTNGANLANVERKIEETVRNREAHRAKFTPLTEEQKKKYGNPSAPTAIPRGAIPGKKDGVKGYQLNGEFHPLADIVL